MRWFILFVGLTLIPVSLSASGALEDTADLYCNEASRSVDTRDSGAPVLAKHEYEILVSEIDSLLERGNSVVVCIERESKSSGHGALNLKWDQREIAEMILSKDAPSEGTSRIIRVYKELDPPIGKWYIPSDSFEYVGIPLNKADASASDTRASIKESIDYVSYTVLQSIPDDNSVSFRVGAIP